MSKRTIAATQHSAHRAQDSGSILAATVVTKVSQQQFCSSSFATTEYVSSEGKMNVFVGLLILLSSSITYWVLLAGVSGKA